MHKILSAFFVLFFTFLTAVAQDIHPKILEDWKHQELAAIRTLGSRQSLEALIETARKMNVPQLEPEIQIAQEALKREVEDFMPGQSMYSEKLHFISVLPPMANPEKIKPYISADPSGKYDFRVFYPWPNGELYTETWCRTGQTVVYRVHGMNPDVKYTLRIVFTSDFERVQPVFLNGEKIEDVKIPGCVPIERLYDLPQGKTEAVLEIHYTKGPNVTVAEAALLSETPPTPEKKAEVEGRLPKKWAAPFKKEWIRLRTAMRKALFASPEIDFDEILFVKRHWPQGNHQCAHRVGENQTAGADLMILKGLDPAGAVRGLLPPELAAKCGVGRPDLSCDAKKIIFPLAWPREKPTPYPWGAGHAHYDPKNPTDMTYYHGGAVIPYDIFEINVDGTGLKNLTNTPDIEDTEPCFLPDGRIVFTSTRGGRVVQCGDWSPVFGLHVMNADGSDVHAISQPQDTEFYPSMLEDGRFLFTRWDYVMKPYNMLQEVWAMNPDGTRSVKIYGDWYKFSRGPLAFQEVRQIPGTRKLVGTGAAHHNSGVGPILVANMSLNRLGPEGMKNLTPEIHYAEVWNSQTDERLDKTFNDLNQKPLAAGWFTSPWPLSERLFLCVFSPAPNNLTDSYGIYLLTDYGMKELIFRFDETSCYAPIPLKPRPAAPVVADMERFPEGTPGTLVLQDVYRGLDGIERGTVKWLRVCETYPKCRHTNPHRVDMGVSCGWDARGVLGYVPVEADGFASFEVPSDRMIFLEALDENFLEVQRMRNYVTLRPGEVQGCVGCHESPLDVSPVSRTAGGPHVTAKVQPPAYGAGPMQFERVIQPILDAKCVTCHDGAEGKTGPDLKSRKHVEAPHRDPDEGPQHTVSEAFLNLLPHVSYYVLEGHRGLKTFQPPRSFGSYVSPLMKRLKETPCGKDLTQDEWRAFSDWIDCNAPYYGSYDEDFLHHGAE